MENVKVINNVTTGQDLIPVMVETLDEIIEILQSHCGPYSDYAIIFDPRASNAEPIFTKDGINIVRSIQYTDRIKEFTRSCVQYIGSRIESSAGDGTTSAMIICANILKLLLKEFQENDRIKSISTVQIASFYKEIQEAIEERYDHFYKGVERMVQEANLSLADTKKLITNIAYWQAYTSSHGDIELSESISKLFSETPIDAWDGLSIESSRYETDFRYKTVIDEAQYTLEDVRPFPVTQVKDALGLECNRDNSRVIISELPLCLSFVDTLDTIKKVEEAAESGEELTVIFPDDFKDNATLVHFDELFKKYPNHNVIFFLVSCRDKLNDILGSKVLGIPGVNEDGEHNITYRFKGSTLKLVSGLYPETDESTYPYTDNHTYRDLMEHVEEVIKGMNNQEASENINRVLKHVHRFKFKMTVIKRPCLILGGSSYDNVAAVDVAIDAISATKKSLTEGFVLGGNKCLYTFTPSPSKTKTWFQGVLCGAIRKSIEEVYSTITKHVKSDRLLNVYDSCSYNVLDSVNGTVENVQCGNAKWILKQSKEKAVIIQPKTMDLELIKRFGEVALKFFKINKLITRV